MNGFMLICLGFFSQMGWAQENEIPFRARFLMEDGSVAASVGGKIEGQSSFITDSNGEISLLLAETQEVRISLASSDLVVIYPQNQIVPVPRDQFAFAQIILNRRGAVNQTDQLIGRIESLQATIIDSDAAAMEELSALKAELTSLFDERTAEAVATQMSLYEQLRKENDRRDSLSRAEQSARILAGRNETMKILIGTMDQYISRSQDLRDIFEFQGARALNNGYAAEELSQKIEAYNEAYEDLNRNRNFLLSQSEQFWAEDLQTQTRLRDLLEYALDDVHKMSSLSANNLIQDMADFRDPRVRRRDKRAKREIVSDIDRFTYDLRNKLSTLNSRKSELYRLLEESDLTH